MDKTPNKSQSSLLGIFINILLPVLILAYSSAGPANPLERPEGENFWHIGPVWALVIALSLPLVYGIRSLVVSRKFDLMSVVGMAGVLLTGVISIFVIGPEGRIHSATPWLFAGKEALIPLILAAAVVVSRSAGTPLLNTFIYTPELFDVRRIEQTVAANGEERAYQKLLTPFSVEKELVKHIPEAEIPIAHHWLILHGRYICQARTPQCDNCGLQLMCKYYCQKYKVSKENNEEKE